MKAFLLFVCVPLFVATLAGGCRVAAAQAQLAPNIIPCPDDAKVCRGTMEGDYIDGANKAQTLNGRGGPDILKGHGGDDTLEGRGGRDRLVGGHGQNMLLGGGGNDVLKARIRDYAFCGDGAHDKLIMLDGYIEYGDASCEIVVAK